MTTNEMMNWLAENTIGVAVFSDKDNGFKWTVSYGPKAHRDVFQGDSLDDTLEKALVHRHSSVRGDPSTISRTDFATKKGDPITYSQSLHDAFVLRDKCVRNAALIWIRYDMKPLLKLIGRQACRQSTLEVNETRSIVKLARNTSGTCKCGPCRLRREVAKLKWLDPSYVCRQDREGS